MTGYLLISALVAGLLHHLVHESSHMLMAWLQGVQIHRVHWFTYAGLGTRVFYRDEPAMTQAYIDPKWGLISLAGLIGTTVVGYLLSLAYWWGAGGFTAWPIFLLFSGCVIFLLTDPLYFLLGAVFGFGDVVGVMKVYHVRKSGAVVMSAALLGLAAFTIAQVWYRT